jgi:hypothetical protein
MGACVKALVAIMSYPLAAQNGMNQAQRDTWIPQLKYDYRFFMPGKATKPDEIDTCAVDDYWAYWQNFRYACGWAYNHHYDFMFSCDRDTYVFPENFLSSRFDHHDYVGYPMTYDKCHVTYGSLGAGCWFSRRALYVCSQSARLHEHSDASAGMALSGAGISLWHDPHYFIFRIPVVPGLISMHLSRGTFDYQKEWMYEIHKEFLDMP